MLGADDGGAQFPVDAAYRCQKVGGGDGIQLRSGLVQNEHRRLHGHDGRQIQKLLLAARQLGNILIKPVFNAEKAGHFGHSPADGGGVKAKTFQTEGQLVPYLVGDNLVVGVLQHKTDACTLLPKGQVTQGGVFKENFALQHTVRGQRGLELPQKGGLAAAGRTAKGDKFTGVNGQIQSVNGLILLFGVGKAQIFERKAFHLRSSFQFRIRGRAHRAV